MKPEISLGGLLNIFGPLSVVTALLFYFGWVRTEAYGRSFGVDPRLFDLSTSDYLLRSIEPMFLPVAVGALALGMVWALVPWLISAPRRGLRWLVSPPLSVRLRLGAAGLSIVGVLRLPFIEGGAWPYLTPLAFLGAAALLFLSDLSGRLSSSWGNQTDPGPHRPTHSLVVLLALLGAFVFVFRAAHDNGNSAALALKLDPTVLPAVEIASAEDLGLAQIGATISESEGGEYRYRYSNLRLLQFADDRYFLIDGCPGGATQTAVLPATNDFAFRVVLRPMFLAGAADEKCRP